MRSLSKSSALLERLLDGFLEILQGVLVPLAEVQYWVLKPLSSRKSERACSSSSAPMPRSSSVYLE